MAHKRIRLLPFYRDGDCMIWAGGFNSNYAPEISDAGRKTLVSRVVYREFIGHIPGGRRVLRRCKNRACINPEHLFIKAEKLDE